MHAWHAGRHTTDARGVRVDAAEVDRRRAVDGPAGLTDMWPVGYSSGMLEVRRTEVYARWLDGLRDVRARARVLVRVERLAAGNPGDVGPVGEGVSELRIDYGPGYRVYFKRQGRTVVVLLAGGNKRTQGADIETALRLARNL